MNELVAFMSLRISLFDCVRPGRLFRIIPLGWTGQSLAHQPGDVCLLSVPLWQLTLKTPSTNRLNLLLRTLLIISARVPSPKNSSVHNWGYCSFFKAVLTSVSVTENWWLNFKALMLQITFQGFRTLGQMITFFPIHLLAFFSSYSFLNNIV